MAKSVIVAGIIILIMLTASIGSFYYTSKTVNEFSVRLEKAGADPHELEKIISLWNQRKQPMMFIINHRDIESISTSLIRAHREAVSGRVDMAIEEIEVVMFLMEELIEKERLSPENIF